MYGVLGPGVVLNRSESQAETVKTVLAAMRFRGSADRREHPWLVLAVQLRLNVFWLLIFLPFKPSSLNCKLLRNLELPSLITATWRFRVSHDPTLGHLSPLKWLWMI